MRNKMLVIVTIVSALALALAACSPQEVKTTVEVTREVEVTRIVEQEGETVVVTAVPTPDPEAVIEDVEDGAEITLWTFWLSPTFDDYINDTTARFQQVYPGVTVNWEDHQATFQDDLRNAFAAGNAPDVINLSLSEGWVSDYASQGLLLPLDDVVPQEVVDQYFPNLWEHQVVDGKHYQFPWYQGVIVNLVNTQILDQAGLTVEDFPKTTDEIPAFCQTIKDETGTLCTVRLTVNDLLAQMTYQGGVQVINDDGTEFTFDSPDAVEWLQMYVDMVAAGTVDRTVLVTDQDRVGLDVFASGQSAFYNTGVNLIREVRENNPGLYGYLSVVPAPVGKSGVVGKGLMALSVKADTEYPNASIALAAFITDAQNMVEFSKLVSIYPSTPASYDDPFFSSEPVAIEDSVKPLAKDAVSKLADIVPYIPHKADVNEIVLQAVQQALFNDVPAQQALSDAVEQANALLP